MPRRRKERLRRRAASATGSGAVAVLLAAQRGERVGGVDLRSFVLRVVGDHDERQLAGDLGGLRVRRPDQRRLFSFGAVRTLVDAHHDGRDVVGAALPPSLQDQALGGLLRIAAGERDADVVGAHRAAEAVAAEQQHVARQEVLGELVDARLRLGAQGAAQDAAVRMDGRLFLGQAAVAHHLADERVVVADLPQLAVAQQVGAAVADVGEARQRRPRARRR